MVSAIAGLAIAAVGDPGSLPERADCRRRSRRILFLFALAYPRGMGLGDVKLAAVMGLYLGRCLVPAMLIALFAGAAVGIGLIAREGASARKRALPFGPFLALGGVVGLLAGPELINWYLATFSQ